MEMKCNMGKVFKKKCPWFLILLLVKGNQIKYLKRAWDITKAGLEKTFNHASLKKMSNEYWN